MDFSSQLDGLQQQVADARTVALTGARGCQWLLGAAFGPGEPVDRPTSSLVEG